MRGRSSRARQAAVVVLDKRLEPGLAIPAEKIICPLGHFSAHESWLVAPPYITRLTMVRTAFWLQRNRTLAGPARRYSSDNRFTWHVVIASLASPRPAWDALWPGSRNIRGAVITISRSRRLLLAGPSRSGWPVEAGLYPLAGTCITRQHQEPTAAGGDDGAIGTARPGALPRHVRPREHDRSGPHDRIRQGRQARPRPDRRIRRRVHA